MSQPVVFASNCASDRGLSSTGHPVQPKDTFLMKPFSPFRYLSEHVNSGVRQAQSLVLVIGSVEGGLSSG